MLESRQRHSRIGLHTPASVHHGTAHQIRALRQATPHGAYAAHPDRVGSTFVRARRISDEILSRSVPVPSSTPSPDQNDFLHAIIASVEEAAEEVGCRLT